jgi:hypothetical protein
MPAPAPVLKAESPSAARSVRSAPTSYFATRSGRDPTISPDEYVRLKEEEDRRLETERQRRILMMKRRKESGGESRINLQGIVGGNMIINGEMYSVGDTVMGVKLLKMGSNYVIGEYRGRQFKKVLK